MSYKTVTKPDKIIINQAVNFLSSKNEKLLQKHSQNEMEASSFW